jgi:hypothetical protein
MTEDYMHVVFVDSVRNLRAEEPWSVDSSDKVYGGTLPRIGDEVCLRGDFYKVLRVVHFYGNREVRLLVTKEKKRVRPKRNRR